MCKLWRLTQKLSKAQMALCKVCTKIYKNNNSFLIIPILEQNAHLQRAVDNIF